MFQKLFLVIFILLSISLGANDGIPQERGQKVSLQLLWKHQFEFAGFYIAKEKGFYKDNNLEVELKEYQFGVDITKDVESGESTFGVGYPSLILDKANGSNIVLLNSIYQSSPHILITLKSSGIKSIEEFKNKKIMIENNTIKAVPFMGMLFSKGIKKEDVNILKPTFDIEDLIQGKTDIFAAYISNEVYKLNKKDLKYNIWNPADYGFDFYNDILFTSSKMLKNDNSKVKRFQEASLKGWRYAFAHIDETVELILNKYNTQNKTKEALLYEAKTLKKLAYKGNIAFGDIDKNKIQRIYDIYNLMGLTNNKIDLDTFLYCPNPEHILLTKKERQYLKDNPIITVHNEQNWPPYNFNENGKAKGFSIDYIKLVAQKLGIKIKFIDGYTWNEFMDMVKTNKIDILLNTIKTKSREESLNFTTGYTNSTKFIFTNDNNIKTLDALKGKIVAVTEGFFIHKFLE
ncbi:MAG: ABC transporter substrate-binding protein, partial [Arcobacteraceae bacterium]|nr:ABC transporter substrate-binding protein [Arcobacteraceae bacterium]